jgi:phage baseplate assembly protein W
MMSEQFQQIASRIDSEELTKIKNTLALRDRANADRYELTQRERRNPGVLFGDYSSPSSVTESTLQGLKYPLELDGKGGFKLSANYDRVGEQILEVLSTRIGERAYRPFFGLQEMMFETIDEYTLAQSIRSKLLAFIPLVSELDVNVSLDENGTAGIVVLYSVEGSEQAQVRYSFSL